MRTIKQYVAGILACTILVSSVDLSWCNLSGALDTLAAEATDCYKSYSKLANAVGNYYSNADDLMSALGIKATTESTDTTASDATANFSWENINGAAGLYTFNQKNIEGTSQYKSGNWLDDTLYEATSGTPTTEDVFMTAGGTQWIVDMQYRFLKAPYQRTYKFNAEADNYRYYKLGSTRSKKGESGEVSYKATMEVPYDKDPATYSKYEYSHGGYNNNYGYKYHMGYPDDEEATLQTFGVPCISGGEKTISCLNPETWDKSDKVAPVEGVAVTGGGSSDTESVDPDVAQAILVKQQVYKAITELKKWWEQQSDNYRRDVGSYNTEESPLKDDDLGFMYTYAGMARYGTIQGDNTAQLAGSGDQTYSDNLWTPTFVSYLYDWQGYHETDRMDTDFGSKAHKLYTVGAAIGGNKTKFYEAVKNMMKSPEGTKNGKIYERFALRIQDNPVLDILSGGGSAGGSFDKYKDNLKVSTEYAQRMIANGADENIAIVLNDWENAYAFSYKGKDNMNLTDNELGNSFNAYFNLNDTSYLELEYAYYRAVYTLACNYGCMFYADEATDLFDGLPGFKTPSDVKKYNEMVNGNLAAAFGSGNTYFTSKQVFKIPFAIFPYGGDLDGEMTDAASTTRQNSITSSSGLGIVGLGGITDKYIYFVKMTFKEDISESLNDTGTVVDYISYWHNTNANPRDGGNVNYCAGDNDVQPNELPEHTGCNAGASSYTDSNGDSKCDGCTNAANACTCAKQTCSHNLGKHLHYKVLTSDGNRRLIASSGGKTAKDYNHADRVYEETYTMSFSYKIEQGGEGDIGGDDDWSWTRRMSDSQVLVQEFKDVQWLDITSYTLWHMNDARVKGLSAILANPTSTNGTVQGDEIVTGAVNKMGYTVYNLKDNVATSGTTATDNAVYTNINGVLTDLQGKGRLANSFNKGSLGNGNASRVSVKGEYNHSSQSAGTTGGHWSNNNKIRAYLKNDVPDLSSWYINDDFAAYHISSVSDDGGTIEFTYNPYAQGGRSHTTFYGFVSQALAHTLYFKHNSGEDHYSANLPGISYSNSIRVQGDYLSLNRTDGITLTMAGMLYDTWNERFGTAAQGHYWDGGKFSLLPNGWNDLTIYSSTCPWVPGRLQYLLARGDSSEIYADGSITSTNNCFIIHTYCHGINSDTHCCWDMLQNAQPGSPDCNGIDCAINTPTDKGNINTQENDGKNITKDYDGIECNFVGEPGTIDTSKTVKLADVISDNSEYYRRFGATGYRVNNNKAKIDIPLTNYMIAGANTQTMMTDLINLANGMPYVGYQSQGNGTQLIKQDGNEANTQKGYISGLQTYFNKDSTYVSDTPMDGGFKRFGVTPVDQPVVVTNQMNGAQYKDDLFSQNYPWLSSLNLKRSLANNRYNTGSIFIEYSQIANNNDGTTSRNVHNNSSAPFVDTHYIKGSATATSAGPQYRPNDIVVYNPVSTESSRVVPLSKYLTDASNTGTSNGSRKYKGAYMDSFLTYVLRDTRLSSKYRLNMKKDEEQYLTGSGVNTATTVTKSTTHYELRGTSRTNTSAYTCDDYQPMPSTDTETIDIKGDFDSTIHTVASDGKFDMTYMFDSNNWVSSSVDLYKDDTIRVVDDGVVLTMGNQDFDLQWKAFTDAYALLENKPESPSNNVNIGLPLTEGMSFTIGSGEWQLRKGSLISVSLKVTKDSTDDGDTNAIAKAITLSDIGNVDTHFVQNGTTYTWYLEAKDAVNISGLNFTINSNCYLWNSTNMLETHDVVLMYLGTEPPPTLTSYWFNYERASGGSTNSKRHAHHNSYAVDVRSEYYIEGMDLNVSGSLYGKARGSSLSISLENEAITEPHKVPNSCWMYYVLGWQTTTGHIVIPEDIRQALNNPNNTSLLLNNPNTTFYLPSGGDGTPNSATIKVNTILTRINAGTLGIYKTDSGSYGLIDINTNGTFSRTSTYTGITVSKFAIMSFAYGTAEEIHEGSIMVNPYVNHAYECVWRATKTSGICYDVKYSQNIQHKCTVGSSDDWDEVPDIKVSFTAESYKALFGDTLSLDDEFTIYWDNYASLSTEDIVRGSLTNHNVTSVSKVLGRGWDNLEDSQTDLPNNKHTEIPNLPKVPIDGTEKVFWDTYVDRKLTDTTKWIKNKYVIFNTDMYAFTTGPSFTYEDDKGDSQFDPTTPAYNSDGTHNNIVYIPAGEKVYLGKYSGDTEADNSGKFVDYGFNSSKSIKTKDPNGDLYTYHFWCPLSNGETEEGATVQFVVEAINGRSNTSNNLPSSPKSIGIKSTTNSSTELKDEWGNTIVTASGIKLDNNSKIISGVNTTTDTRDGITSYETSTSVTDVFKRYNNSVNSATYNIQGRVGALTVVDSGDPRYQDTFKASLNTGEFAISPIVYLIDKYSNNPNQRGSQLRYLTDVMDVRGRMLFDSGDYVEAKSGNSYGNSEWHFGVTDVGRRFKLPMTSNFNIHEELRNTLSTSKLGYELYCSLQTIGNFYGSAGPRTDDVNEKVVNNNLDYGQSKVQVHPMYVALEKTATGWKTYAVDVYVRRGSSYSLINAGSMYASEEEANGEDSGPYYLDDAYDATYTSYINTNTYSEDANNAMYSLDQNMMRRMVTDEESRITYSVVKSASYHSNNEVRRGITTTMLEPNTYDESEIGGSGLGYEYIYGNAQFLFLREFNRTFMGGTTLALNESKSADTNSLAYAMQENSKKYVQKYYFGLGLPSSAVFVKHGEDTRESNILNGKGGIYILCAVDVYAIGEKWALHYQSEISNEDIVINNTPFSNEKWNVYREKLPHLIPVSIYDMSKTSSTSDMDTHGSH